MSLSADQKQITRECALCGFTTQDAIVVCPEDGSALVTHKPDPLIGTVVSDRFEIHALIGSGGMGNVYKATQKIVERTVAVKVMHSEKLQKREAVLRFQQEARAAGSLNHPNIVGFFDFGLTDDNVPFIVMDYIQGASLFDVLKQSTLPLDRFINIFSQICDALEHAHSKGIIHRDIKPSNVMLVRNEDGSECVKILDFGIAKLLPRHDLPARVTLTQTGELFGSPQYMSPEQFAGLPLDTRSDMYSLGCVMYEALTGQAPVTADSIIELVQKHTNEPPAPMRSIKPDLDIPKQLEAVVFKTLEKDPEQRFPTMAVLKHNLEFVPKFAEAEKSAPPEPTIRLPRTADATRRRSTQIALGVALGSALIGGIAVAGMIYGLNPPGDTSLDDAFTRLKLVATQSFDPNNEERILEYTEKLRDSYAHQGIKKEALAYANDAVGLARRMKIDGWRGANQLLRKGQIEEQFHARESLDSYGYALSWLRTVSENNRAAGKHAENLDGKQPIDATVVELARKQGGDPKFMATDLWNMAEDMHQAKLIDNAANAYEELLSLKDQLTPSQKIGVVDGLTELARAESGKGNDRAEDLYKKAMQLASETDGAQSQKVAEIGKLLGNYYKDHGQITKSESTLMDALATAQAAGGEHSPLVIELYNDLGEVYRSEKEFDKATEMFKLAERLRQ